MIDTKELGVEAPEITVLNQAMEEVLIIDVYFSLVWPELYSSNGEFTLEVPLEFADETHIIEGNYLVIEESERVMIITNLNPVENEQGAKLVITGVSGEALLKSRALNTTIFIDGSVQVAVNSLINSYFITSSLPNQNTPEIVFGLSTDTDVTSATITNTYEPASLYDVIKAICDATNMGFKIIVNSQDKFEVQLYYGKDRSYDQVTLTPVIFSEEYDNVEEASFYIATNEYKNVAVVITEDLVHDLVYVWEGTEPSGINRKEIVVDATTITRTVPDAPDLTDQEYLNVITQKGLDEIHKRAPVGIFDGDVDVHGSFVINKDFYLGDIVQCVFIGRETSARIIEFVRSYSEAGNIAYAAFEFNL